MRRLRRFDFHERTARIAEVANWFRDSGAALSQFYSPEAANLGSRFALYSPAELNAERTARQYETDTFAAFGALAALEAALREDYIIRCIKRQADPLSTFFDRIYAVKGLRASLGDDILEGWKRNSTVESHVIGQIRSALKYRHWLAHGRYWQPNFGQKFDFASVYEIANAVLSAFPLLTR